jgi:hypothetical protein
MWQWFGSTCAGLLVFWLTCIGPFAWLLRDGLGPRAVDSHGWAALGRFLMTFYWGPVAVLLGVLAAACAWSARRPTEPEEQQEGSDNGRLKPDSRPAN